MKPLVPANLARDWQSDEPDVQIIGNLPFSIASPLLIMLLKQISEKSELFSYGRIPMTFVFQKEVGQRLIAQPYTADYSRLSIMAQYLCNVRLKFLITGIYAHVFEILAIT